MAKEILIIEDDAFIAGLLGRGLVRKGYTVTVVGRNQALKRARKHNPSLVLLEAPGDAAQVSQICQHVRSTTSAPILVLTDVPIGASEADGIAYLTKPVDFRAVLAAAEYVLDKRSRRRRAARLLRCGDLCLDLHTHLLTKGDHHYHLTPKEFELLRLFMSKPGEVLTHKAILREVWNTEWEGDIRTLHVHVSWLRKKIEDDRHHPLFLRTIRGVGYCFEART